MQSKEKGRANGPIPSAVVFHDGSEFIASLPPIQADPSAERKFALELAARVFGSNSQIEKLTRRRLRVWRPA